MPTVERRARRPGSARVCIVSLRGVSKHAAWCSNYEFEDVVASVDDVDMYTLEPGSGFEARNWLARRVAWKPGLRQFTPFLNPGLKRVVIDREYDLFVFVCMNPSDLIYLGAIEGWQQRCKKRICYMVEFYSGWANEYAYHLSLLVSFDFVAQSFSSCVDVVARASGRPCHAVPLGVDTLRFTPLPNPLPRSIDIYSMGRRVETVHEALLEHARRRDIFYIYDTIPSLNITPRDHVQHRELVANLGKRARFFIAYPAKVDVADETRGASEVGARFFEGAAMGATLLGKAPTVPAFRRDFHWPDAIIELGSTAEAVDTFLATLQRERERHVAAGRRNAVEALRRFDWAYRWKELLRLANVEPHPSLEARERQLNELAALAAA
jgi:Glycosyl transferases group 1